MTKQHFKYGDTIYFIEAGMLEEGKILSFKKQGEFVVYSGYLEKEVTVIYGQNAFIRRQNAINKRRELAEEKKKNKKEENLAGWYCPFCYSYNTHSGDCGCR